MNSYRKILLARQLLTDPNSVIDTCAAREVMGFKIIDDAGLCRMRSGQSWDPTWKVRPFEAMWWDPIRERQWNFDEWSPTNRLYDCVRVYRVAFPDDMFPYGDFAPDYLRDICVRAIFAARQGKVAVPS